MTTDRYVSCSRCGRKFTNSGFLLDHIRNVHAQDDIEKQAEQRMNPYNSTSTIFEDKYRDFDATKNIGYPARETGRYGSPPSHDGSDNDDLED